MTLVTSSETCLFSSGHRDMSKAAQLCLAVTERSTDPWGPASSDADADGCLEKWAKPKTLTWEKSSWHLLSNKPSTCSLNTLQPTVRSPYLPVCSNDTEYQSISHNFEGTIPYPKLYLTQSFTFAYQYLRLSPAAEVLGLSLDAGTWSFMMLVC